MDNTIKNFIDYKNLFKVFFDVISKEYSRNNEGHGIDHDITVAQFAIYICPDERTAKMAWVAAMMHSQDRVNNIEDEISFKDTIIRLSSFLPKVFFSQEEQNQITEAVLKHSEKNKDNQSLVHQVLQDADRLANLDLLVVARTGQFRSTVKGNI